MLARICLGIMLVAAQACAAPILLLEYTFPTAHSGETGAGYNPTTVASGLDPTWNMAVRDTAGRITIEISNPSPNYATQPVLRVDPDGSSANLTAAVANNKYYEFSLSPLTGYFLDLDRLEFVAARGGGSTPRGWGLYSSADGFTTAITSAVLGSQRPNWASFVVDLSGPLFQNLDESLTFRVYVYSPGDGSTIEFDNMRLYGRAYTPEPASLSLLGLGGLLLFRLRQRRTRR